MPILKFFTLLLPFSALGHLTFFGFGTSSRYKLIFQICFWFLFCYFREQLIITRELATTSELPADFAHLLA